MLHLINEELFSFKFTDDETSQASRFPHHMDVCSANELLRYRESNPDVTPVKTEKLSPIGRKILTVHGYDTNFFEHPMSMKVTHEDSPVISDKDAKPRKAISVELRCLDDRENNRVNLYVIAFPFNGRMVPLKEDPKYRIYKGTMASAGRSFWYNGRKYRKTLYLVIEPNLRLFDPTHKYHCDKIEITLEAMGIYVDKNDDNKRKTNHETMTVTITNSSGEFEVQTSHEVLNEAVELESLTSCDLWKTFEFEPKEKRLAREKEEAKMNRASNKTENSEDAKKSFHTNKNHAPKASKSDGFSKKPRERQEPTGIKVTVNKHGIRKEVPIYASSPRSKPKSYVSDKPFGPRKQVTKDKNLDPLGAMIEEASLIKATDYRGKSAFVPKRNRKSGGKH